MDCSDFQLFYADDGAAAGKLTSVRKWWDKLCIRGPGYGYFPNGAKSVLLVKKHYLQKALDIFDGTDIHVTTEGVRYLGSPIGTDEFRSSFVSEKVENWVSMIELLSAVAVAEPQCAYS